MCLGVPLGSWWSQESVVVAQLDSSGWLGLRKLSLSLSMLQTTFVTPLSTSVTLAVT